MCKASAVQVKQGPKLRSVIQAVLTVGNAVNVGTAYGNAQGIRLDSLLKLADVKVSVSSGVPWASPCLTVTVGFGCVKHCDAVSK